MFRNCKSNRNLFKGLILLIILLSTSYNSYGYVMPAEQLLDFMTKNFSGYKTVVLIQSTFQTADNNEKVFSEQISLKSPDLYSTKVLDRLGGRSIVPDLSYLRLLVANDETDIEHFLSSIGVDLQKVSFTRLDDKIAYRIGAKDPDSPKLLIEKDRFVPILLTYKLPGELNDKTITIRFQDYRKENDGWYPYEITYKSGENLVEEYTIQSLQFNVPVDSSTLKQFPQIKIPDQPAANSENNGLIEENPAVDKDRLRDVIKAFEHQHD